MFPWHLNNLLYPLSLSLMKYILSYFGSRNMTTCTANSYEGSPDAPIWYCFDHDIVFSNYSLMRSFEPGNSVMSGKLSAGRFEWELQYFPNGVDENTEGHVSVFLRLPNAESDQEIRTRFHIVMCDNNQNYSVDNPYVSPLDHSVHMFSAQNSVWGFNRFISKNMIDKKCWNKYDDTIRFKCYIWVTKEFTDSED
jgi:MATH domain